MYEWRDKVVVITGASNGIGACVVRQALEEGAKHVSILDVDDAAGETLQNELNSKYRSCKTQYHRCDVTKDDNLFGVFQSVVENQGYIDVVINNAGIFNESQNVYKKEIELNVTALVTSTLKALELMRVDEGGRGGTIINIASTGALTQASIAPVYFGTKAAVLHFSSCIGRADYFAKTGVRVMTVCFGATLTSIFSAAKLGSSDKNVTPDVMHNRLMSELSFQKVESAARGVIEAYKRGASASTWVATRDLPVRDITENITRGYEIMGEYN